MQGFAVGKLLLQNRKLESWKNYFFKTKAVNKRLKKRIKPNKLIVEATKNMKTVKCKKYGLSPTKIETESITSEFLKIKYHIYRLAKVKKDAGRRLGSDRNHDIRIRKKLRDLLKTGDLVLSLPETLKKRCAWKNLQKHNRKQVIHLIEIKSLSLKEESEVKEMDLLLGLVERQ